MNFDELKNQWDNQSIEKVTINKDMEHKHASTIIDRVRKVMKKDFFYQITIFPMLLLYPFFFDINTPVIWFVLLAYITIMVIPFTVLVKFYRASYKLEYNSLKSLNWFYYNYKFSIDVFRIYNYITFVLVIMFLGIVFLEGKRFEDFGSVLNLLAILFVSLTAFAFFCVWITRWWINKFYAKPLLEIKEVLDALAD